MEELTPIEDIKAIVESKEEPVIVEESRQAEVKPITKENEFQRNVQQGLNAVAQNAFETDRGFQKEITDKTKESVKSYAELETERAELERQNVQYHSEILKTQQELEFYRQADHKWDNQRSKRRFIYDGVKPVMEMIGVHEPMNVFLMVVLTTILIIPFLFIKPITALIVGANPDDRKKQAKSWLWTLVALGVTAVIIIAIWIPCKYFGVIK